MIKQALIYIVLILSYSSIFGCENNDLPSYPVPMDYIDEEIDEMLCNAETHLFTNQFNKALDTIDRAASLIPLAKDKDDYRKLRLFFDKAVIITCIEGPSTNSHFHFSQFNQLLSSKHCQQKGNDKEKSSQPNLFDKNGHWPILGPNVLSVADCIEIVEASTASAMICFGKLKITPIAAAALEGAIFMIGSKAKKCCTEHGFWKTCLQPVVDTWKRTEIFGIPPDPYWD